MADDTIWNFVNEYLSGNISREVFWEYAKFKHPTHQISFHTLKALDCLKFEGQQLVLATIKGDDVAQAIIDVFTSFISDEISNFNTNVYYSNPDYLRCSYEAGFLLA